MLRGRRMDYWFIWESQWRLIGIGDACPSAEESVEIETLDAIGLISRDHAIVGLIQASKVDNIGKRPDSLNSLHSCGTLKATAQGWGAMIDSGLPCWSDALKQFYEIVRILDEFCARIVIVV